MISSIPLIGSLVDLGGKVFDRIFPDTAQAEKAKQEFAAEILKHSNELQKAAASIVHAEAASSHWLAANWRPLTMLVFLGLIVARMFGYTAENISPEEYQKLWSIMEIGIGGYIVSRGAEKILPTVMGKK